MFCEWLEIWDVDLFYKVVFGLFDFVWMVEL